MTMGNNSACVAVPILPGKIGNVKNLVDDFVDKRRGDVEKYLRDTGVKKVLTFIQGMQVGDYIVEYVETNDSLETAMDKASRAEHPLRDLAEKQFRDITGMDRSAVMREVAKIEKLYEWKDTSLDREEKHMVRMPWVWATPIRSGKTDSLRHFWQTRREEHGQDAVDHFKSLNIIDMKAFLQHLPQGDFLIQYMCASSQLDKVLLKCMSADTKSSKFVKSAYLDFSGVDYSQEKNAPDLQMIFFWDAARGLRTTLQEISYTL